MLALLHRLLQFFLVIGKKSVNLAVGFVADSVNLKRPCRRFTLGWLAILKPVGNVSVGA
jgi:hypothetical protein